MKYKIGMRFTANCGIDCEIIDFPLGKKQYATVVWLDSYRHVADYKLYHLVSGKVCNPFAPVVYGIGFIGCGDYTVKDNKREHSVWSSMMARAYNEDYKRKKPTYIDVTVDERWHNFQNFADWCQNQKGFLLDNYELDKDLLVSGNRVYQEDACLFVPNYINSILSGSDAIRGTYPLGVCLHSSGSCFTAQIKNRTSGRPRYLGIRKSPEEAHRLWQLSKSETILQTVELYKCEPAFDYRVANSLLSKAEELKFNAENGIETKSLY